jgi:phosphoglycerate dehydrogenase-like enzyme
VQVELVGGRFDGQRIDVQEPLPPIMTFRKMEVVTVTPQTATTTTRVSCVVVYALKHPADSAPKYVYTGKPIEPEKKSVQA